MKGNVNNYNITLQYMNEMVKNNIYNSSTNVYI